MKAYLEAIEPFVLDYLEQARELRRALHKIPESGFHETRTQAFILKYLRALGYEPETLCATGVALFIPGSQAGSAVALRSDIDALEINEPESCDFHSEHPGMMHACGHDGHMTMLLLTAKILKEHPEIEHRDTLLIFQPAEEGPGGAGPMCESGIFERCGVSEIYGYHLFPFVEEGVISTTPGPMMAMTSEFYPLITGRASHAGNPENGIDALVAAAQFVLGAQTIVSRSVACEETALINIGTLEAGERMNIVPKQAKLSGTMRSYNPDVQMLMKERMQALLDGIDTMYGTSSSLGFTDMYPPVRNDAALFEQVWKKIPGPKERFKKVMLAEDFAVYQEHLPGVFIGIGCGSPEYSADLHTDAFNFDESVLLRGVDLYLRLIQNQEQDDVH